MGADRARSRFCSSKRAACATGLLRKGDGFKHSAHYVKMQKNSKGQTSSSSSSLTKSKNTTLCKTFAFSLRQKKYRHRQRHPNRRPRWLSWLQRWLWAFLTEIPHKELREAPLRFGRTLVTPNPPPHTAGSKPSSVQGSSRCICSCPGRIFHPSSVL